MKHNQNYNKLLKSGIIITSCFLATACFNDEDSEEVFTPAKHNAIVATRSGYDSGNHAIIKLSDYSVKKTNYSSGGNDTVVSTYKEQIYRIGRFKMDNITKFDINAPESIIWEFSTEDAVENVTQSSNPYKVVFSNDNKAYLIRYGSKKIWIVNPSANNIIDFRLGEIDLSAYDDADLSPEPSDALVIDDKLYVVMQRLDVADGYNPGTAYLAVFDTSDDSEIVTNSDVATPNGVALSLKNPIHIEYLSSNNTLYIGAVGRYASTFGVIRDAEFTGGIESVNLADYSTSVVLDDGDATSNPYGNITNLAILNSTRGYFVGYNAFLDNTLFTFNPSDNTEAPVALISNKDLPDIEVGPLGDLWVANGTDKGITLIDTVDNSVKIELIDTLLTPINIEFVTLDDTINP